MNVVMNIEFEYKEIDYLEQKTQFIYAWISAFNRNIDQATADWLFGLNSNNRIFVAISASGDIAGGYCLIKQRAVCNSKVITSYLCNNVFTTPEYRSYNIFVRLGRFALNQVKGEETIGFGFPNDLALAGHKRVGWELCEPILFFERSPCSIKFDPHHSFEDIPDDNFLEIENFCGQPNIYSLFFILKNAAYLRWRYIQRPQTQRKYFIKMLKRDNKIVGYAVLSHYFSKNRLHIIDIVCQSKDEFAEMLLRISDMAFYLNVGLINIWGSPVIIPLLTQQNFTQSEERTHLIVKDLSPGQNMNIAQAIRRHHLVLADNDVF